MAIFDNVEKQPSEISIAKLKQNLSTSQLKVARHNYRVIMMEMANYMDINSDELKESVSRGVINRLISYKL